MPKHARQNTMRSLSCRVIVSSGLLHSKHDKHFLCQSPPGPATSSAAYTVLLHRTQLDPPPNLGIVLPDADIRRSPPSPAALPSRPTLPPASGWCVKDFLPKEGLVMCSAGASESDGGSVISDGMLPTLAELSVLSVPPTAAAAEDEAPPAPAPAEAGAGGSLPKHPRQNTMRSLSCRVAVSSGLLHSKHDKHFLCQSPPGPATSSAAYTVLLHRTQLDPPPNLGIVLPDADIRRSPPSPAALPSRPTLPPASLPDDVRFWPFSAAAGELRIFRSAISCSVNANVGLDTSLVVFD